MKNKTLKDFWLNKVGFLSLSSHKSTKHLSHLTGINFNLNDSFVDVRDVVYAFVAGEEILYVGETTCGLKSRFQGYRYGNPLESDTDNRIKTKITSLLEIGQCVDIWYSKPFSFMKLPSGEELKLPESKALEEFLIAKLSPELNVKRLQK